MAAIVLQHAGAQVTLLERIPYESFKAQGAGLGIRYNVIDFVDKYTPKGTTFNIFTRIPNSFVVARDGSRAAELVYETPTLSTSWNTLATALQECLRADTPCHYGATLTGISELENGKLNIEYLQSNETKTLEEVDMVIGADGSRSTVRRLMLGRELSPTYAGYVMYRGTSLASEVSPDIAALHSTGEHSSIILYPGDNHSSISYNIPSKNSTEPSIMYGVYYRHDQAEFTDLMTDTEGHCHPLTLPPGKMRPDMVKKFKETARQRFAPQLAELVEKSQFPSVQAMMDTKTPTNVFMGGKVLLIGEAVTTLRPHIFAGTMQSVFHAQLLNDLALGKIDADEWGKIAFAYSNTIFQTSFDVANLLLNGRGKTAKELGMQSFVHMSSMTRDLRSIELGEKAGQAQQLWNGICWQAC